MTETLTHGPARPIGRARRRDGASGDPADAGTAATSRRLLRRAGLAARLSILYAVVLSAVIAGSVAALLHTTTTGLESVAVSQLNAELKAFQTALGGAGTSPDLRTASTAYLRSHAVPDGSLVEVALPGGWAVANAGGSSLSGQPAIEALIVKAPAQTFDRTVHVTGRTIEVMVAPIDTGDRRAVFLATFDMTGLAPARSAAIRLALAEGAVALAAGIVGAYLLLRRLLRRIGTITDTAERIGRGRLVERLGEQGTADEVGRLAHSFDSMLDRIQDAVVAQEQLLSDVSHQLRTPLTVAKGHLEILQRSGHTDPASVQETLDVAIAELNRMTRLVERVLQLGLAREPLRPDLRDVDLRAFLADFVASCQVLAGRRWILGGVSDAVIRIDETEVRGALLNLVDNSVRATDEGDTIAIRARLDDGVLGIDVEDSGPGIPAPYRDQVLDRYWRPGIRAGSGLGLAIAGAVCRAHEGEIRIGDSSLGGARVTLVLRSLDGTEAGSG